MREKAMFENFKKEITFDCVWRSEFGKVLPIGCLVGVALAIVNGCMPRLVVTCNHDVPVTIDYDKRAGCSFLSPKYDPISTLSLDVDTSSYADIRRRLQGGEMLRAKDVRIEELVNYFRYDYPHPQGVDPVTVACTLAECPWNPKHQLLRLGVQAKTWDEAKLPQRNLTLLVGGGFDFEVTIQKQWMKMLVGMLRDEDHIAIVTGVGNCEGDAKVLLPSVSGREKTAIEGVIDGIGGGGWLNQEAGLRLAYEVAKKNFDRRANNRVVLVANPFVDVGMWLWSDADRELFSKPCDSGISLDVLDFGGYDPKKKELSMVGNGNYAYIEVWRDVSWRLGTNFVGTLLPVAKDVKVQVEFNPSKVEGYRLLGYENCLLKPKGLEDDKKDVDGIAPGHSMTAFYEIVPVKGGVTVEDVDALKYRKLIPVDSSEMFTVKTRYKDPEGGASRETESAHKAEDIFCAEPDEDFRFASAVAEFALLLGDSKYKGDASYARLIERAHNAKGVDREGCRAEFIQMAEMVAKRAQPSVPPKPQKK